MPHCSPPLQGTRSEVLAPLESVGRKTQDVSLRHDDFPTHSFPLETPDGTFSNRMREGEKSMDGPENTTGLHRKESVKKGSSPRPKGVKKEIGKFTLEN